MQAINLLDIHGTFPLFTSVLSFVVVQSLSCVQLFAASWITVRQPSLSLTISCSLLKLMSIESVMPSNHLILCRPLLLSPSIFPSISLFQWLALCIRWPKYWSFSFSLSLSNEYSGMIFFRIDWFEDPSRLLQHHSLKASVLWCSAFFRVQLSHLYMTTGKIIALTIQTFVSSVSAFYYTV